MTCLANLGDVNPVEYGGAFVIVEDDQAELHIWEPDTLQLYRIQLEPHTYINGVLSDNPYHPSHSAWYADTLKDVAKFTDGSQQELIGALTSEDPIEKARAYLDLVAYFHPLEFDPYPLTLTEEEAIERFKDYRQ